MNWLDVVLLCILGISILTSFRKGLTREVIGLVTVVLALALGFWLYHSVAVLLNPYLSSPAVANLAGFVIVFVGVLMAGAIVSHILGRFLKVTGLSIIDHALGAGFGAVRGVLIAVSLILAIMAFSPADRPPRSVVESRAAPYVVDAARVVAAAAPRDLKEGFRKSYAEVKSIWGNTIRPKSEKVQHERKI